jgi:hypothetical protein
MLGVGNLNVFAQTFYFLLFDATLDLLEGEPILCSPGAALFARFCKSEYS